MLSTDNYDDYHEHDVDENQEHKITIVDSLLICVYVVFLQIKMNRIEK